MTKGDWRSQDEEISEWQERGLVLLVKKSDPANWWDLSLEQELKLENKIMEKIRETEPVKVRPLWKRLKLWRQGLLTLSVLAFIPWFWWGGW